MQLPTERTGVPCESTTGYYIAAQNRGVNICHDSFLYNAAALRYFMVYRMIELIVSKILYLSPDCGTS